MNYSAAYKALILLIVGLFLFGACLIFFGSEKSTAPEEEMAYAGEVVNKEIIDASGTKDYRIVIQFMSEHDGERKAATRSISVDKDTYLKAEIGMWFDSRSLDFADLGRPPMV